MNRTEQKKEKNPKITKKKEKEKFKNKTSMQ